MLTEGSLRRYMADRSSFRREQVILPNGRRLGQVEEPWQREYVFGPLDARNPDGSPRYSLLYFELHRGAAKSVAVLAAEVLTTAVLEDDVRVYFAAADTDQAGVAFGLLGDMIRRNVHLAPSFRILRNEIVVPATGTRIKVLASDAPSVFGLGGLSKRLVICCDELHAWRGRDLWDVLYSSVPKAEQWRVIIGSNAGFDTTSVAWEVRELCRTQVDPRYYLYAPEGVVAGWIKPEEVEAQRRTLPPQVFARLWENKWTEGSGAFITREQLARCIDNTWRPQVGGRPGQAYVVGLDLGLVRDRTARAVCHYDREHDQVVLDDLRVWQGTPSHPVDILEVEQDLVAVDRRFNRPAILLDVWQLKSTSQRLSGRLRIHEFTFTGESVRRLSENLLSQLRNAQLRLYPDAELTRELLRLEVKQTSYGWRIDHASGGFSDRAMALGMAAMAAVEIRPTGSRLQEGYRRAAAAAGNRQGPPVNHKAFEPTRSSGSRDSWFGSQGDTGWPS